MSTPDKIVKAVKLPNGASPDAPEAEPATKTARLLKTDGRSSTVTLKYPLEYDGKEYHEITVSRLKGKDFKKMRTMSESMDPERAMLGVMMDAPEAILDEMDFEDYVGVLKASQVFMPTGLLQGNLEEEDSGPSTGGESSSETGQSTQQ